MKVTRCYKLMSLSQSNRSGQTVSHPNFDAKCSLKCTLTVNVCSAWSMYFKINLTKIHSLLGKLT